MKVKLFLTDCDGTLTDGGMHYTADGDVMKKFNSRDGVGLQLLKEHGILTGIITGENSRIVRTRGVKLGLDEILIGIQDKVTALHAICQKYNISTSEVAYIGDDLNDIGILKSVGIAICPADAAQPVRELVGYVTKQLGGYGAVREAAEYVLNQL